MKFRTKNGLRDFQLSLKELNLYGGAIDGLWGSKSALAAADLTRSYGELIGRGPLTAASFPSKADDEASNVITQLQYYMAGFGLYTMPVDGKWGKGTMAGVIAMTERFRNAKNLPTYDIAWSKKVSKQFINRVKAWCAAKGLPPLAASWLMACMYFESGGTFSPSKQNNGGSNYFGLIQFGTAAAKELGTTLKALIAMTQLEQLEYVFKYFEMWEKRGKRYTQLEDFYLTIFYPAAVGKDADQILFRDRTPETIRQGLGISDIEAKSFIQNRGFDINKDGAITIGEICTTIYNAYYTGMDPVNRIQL